MNKWLVIQLLLLLWLTSFQSTSSAQQFVDPREAKVFFKNGDYAGALKIYKKLLRETPSDPEYNHHAGICYLRSNLDKTKAIPYLEKTISLPKFDEEALFHLGMAYQYALRFEDALEMYNKYKKNGRTNEDIERQIETCHTAGDLIKHPVDVKIEHLGPEINSEFPDYYPLVSKDGTFLVFTSRRSTNVSRTIEFDGFYASDIWMADMVNGKPEKARNAGKLVNSQYDEQAVGLSDDGSLMFVYVDRIKEFGDIYTTEKTTRSFKKIEKMDESVNTSYFETSASLSADGNTLLYASDREPGEGGLDLFMTRKLPDGKWAKPQNLGPQINTRYNEDFPQLSGDGETLYFCSQGHKSMGDYDLFRSQWKTETNTWSAPENIGYPINTPEDNRTISFTDDGYAYISALRPEGLGDLDIYKVTFNEIVNIPQVIYRLTIPTGDSLNPFNTNAFVSVMDESSGDIYDYMANERNGAFTIILKPGNYELTVETDNYPMYVKQLKVSEKEANGAPVEIVVELNGE